MSEIAEEDSNAIFESSRTAEIEMDLIPTTEFIRNIQVEYQEVLENQSTVAKEEPDFIITNMTPEVPEEAIEEPNEEEQITLTFDLPINQTKKEKTVEENTVKFDLDEKVKDINVKDYIELIPVTEANDEGETHYAVDNYIELESTMNTQVHYLLPRQRLMKKLFLKRRLLKKRLNRKNLQKK